jgi:hypothetical protein
MAANTALLMGDETLDTDLPRNPRRKRAAKPKAPAMPKASEAQIQRAIIDALRWRGIFAAHIPNAGKRSAMAGKRLKAEGMRPGFPDLACYGHGLHALIEVKADDGRLSDAQHNMHELLRARGAVVIVARSVDEVFAGLADAGWPLR